MNEAANLNLPELNSGFVKAPWTNLPFPLPEDGRPIQQIRQDYAALSGLDPALRQIPEVVSRPLPVQGNVQVTFTFEVTAPGRVTLFANHRQLIFSRVYDAPVVQTVTFILHMGRIVPRGYTEPMTHEKLALSLLGSATPGKVSVMSTAAATLFLMGDSTVTDQSADVPWSPLTCYSGWGQMISAYMDGIAVGNHAHSGLTTESFRSEGHYNLMMQEVKPGDWVLIQFGHNDQKLAHLQAMGGYAENLRTYVREIRAAGAVPVLVTPIARNTWFADGGYNDLLADHAAAVVTVGQELDVPVIDLHGYAMAWIKARGLEASKPYFYPGDFTHTNDHGAYLMAAFMAGQLGALGLPVQTLPAWPADETADRTVPPLGLNPRAAASWQEATTNLPDAIDHPGEALTRADAFDMVVKACKFFGVNVYNDHFDDVTGHEVWAGMLEAAVINGLIPPEMLEGKLLHPLQPIRPYELAAVLMRGALARMKPWAAGPVPDAIPVYAREAVGQLMARGLWQEAWTNAAAITRQDALNLCRRLMAQ